MASMAWWAKAPPLGFPGYGASAPSQVRYSASSNAPEASAIFVRWSSRSSEIRFFVPASSSAPAKAFTRAL